MDDTRFGAVNYCVLFTYLAVMLAIGIVLARRQKSTEEFFLAGRRLPWIVVVMSMFASITSGVSYMGVPGVAYRENISMIVGYAMSPVAAPLLILIFYPFYHRLRVTTSYEYIYRRYGPPARYAVSGLFLAARLGWLGTVLYTPALALSVVIDLPLPVMILIMGVLATAYTALGGLSAAVWTDVIHFLSLVIGALVTMGILIVNIPGGVGGIFDIASRADHLRIIEWRFSPYEMVGPMVALAFLLTLMQDYGCDQVTVQRLLSTNSFRSMAKAAVLNSFFDFCFMSLLLFVGVGLFAYYQSFPDRLPAGLKADKIFPDFVMRYLPNGISGLTISAVFVAAMSCMDSAVNSLVTVIVNDYVKPLRRSYRSDRDEVRLARLWTILIGAFTITVAFYVSTLESILEASNSFLGLFGGPILALFLLGMLTRRATFTGWACGAFIALVVTAYARFVLEWHWIYSYPLSFGLSYATGYIASLVFPGMAPAGMTIHDSKDQSGQTLASDADA